MARHGTTSRTVTGNGLITFVSGQCVPCPWLSHVPERTYRRALRARPDSHASRAPASNEQPVVCWCLGETRHVHHRPSTHLLPFIPHPSRTHLSCFRVLFARPRSRAYAAAAPSTPELQAAGAAAAAGGGCGWVAFWWRSSPSSASHVTRLGVAVLSHMTMGVAASAAARTVSQPAPAAPRARKHDCAHEGR